VAARRGRGRMEPVQPAGAHVRRRVPRRQLPARADGAVRDGAAARRAPAAVELVPVPRGGVAAVPALPEPARDGDWAGRAGGRTRRGVSLVAVPALVVVAGQRLPGGPPVRGGQGGRGRRGRDGPVPGERHRGRLRAARLRVDRVRRLDAAVGVVDAAARVGPELAGDPRRARLHRGGRADRAHRRAALRDRLPRARGAAHLAFRGRPAARRPVAAGRGPPRRLAARVGVGDRPARAAAQLGGRQRAAARQRARERLRRAGRARLAGLGAAARPRPAARRDRVRGGRARTGMAGVVRRRQRGPCWPRSRCACCWRPAAPRSGRSPT
jgi:hypothetical protein